MDKLKNIIKSDTPTADTVPSGNTGKLSGQGSHFPSKDEASVTAPGATAPGTSPQTKGPSDVSAAPTSSTAAATTAGPEQSGSSHINTAPAPSTPAAPAPPIETEKPIVQQSVEGPTDYTVSNADFPKNEGSTDGSGTAAIGQTSTYSSARLTQGDPTSSVVDPNSSDPLTYQKPESSSHTTEAGVGAGAAATAAGLAFTQGEERKKEQMPGYENPYRAANLDPRVDGLSKASAAATVPSSGAESSSRETASGSTAGIAPSAAGIGASQAFNKSQATEDAAAPSALTTAVDPAVRSAEYSASTEEKGLPQTSEQAPTLPPVEANESQSGIFGKVLGAVGLGGVAGAIGATAASDKTASAVAETPDQPTTTTGLETYTAPTQQGPPTGHHRKESIPTTAYPSGTFDSPRAINQPVGGAGSPVVHHDHPSQTSNDTAPPATAESAAVGTAALGAHEYGRSKPPREQITGESQDSVPARGTDEGSTGTVFAHHATTTTEDRPSQGLQKDVSSAEIGDTAAVASPPAYEPTSERATEQPSAKPAVVEEEKKDLAGRDIAVGAGAGAAAVGAGAYGAHEYSKREAEKAEEEAAKERAAHEKEIARHKAEQEKELEKEHKAAEKAAAKEEKQHQKEIEKEEKKQQKEIEKEEKKHQKEIEKEEKKHQKELEKAEKEEKQRKEEAEAAAIKEQRAREKEQARLAKEREEQEEERKIREERERLAGAVGLGGATGAAAAEGEKESEKEKEKEKKPNIFKRIFKRRKNKDTGEEEDYESEEEDKSHHKGATAAGSAAVVGGGTAAYAAERDRSAAPDADTATTAGSTTYEQQSGGVQKPSYSPFHKDENPVVTSAPNEPGPTTAIPSTTEDTTTQTQQPAVAITGVPYDSKTSEPASGLSQHPQSGDAEISRDIAPATIESTGTRSQQPTEAITGLPYDASKDPEAAARLSQHQHGEGIGSLNPTASEKAGEFPVNTNFTLGEVQETHGLGDKIKEALHIGGHKKEDQ